MDTVKTFFNNAAKGPSEEPEAYTTQSSSTDTESSADKAVASTAKTPRESANMNQSTKKSTSSSDVSFDTETKTGAPVVHKHIHHKTIDEDQKIIDRDHDVNHYTKKIQPIQVTKSHGVSHVQGTHQDKSRTIEHEDSKLLNEKLKKDKKDLVSTSDLTESHESVKLDDIVNDKTHHHVHEEIVPVVEEDEYAVDVKRNTTHIKERIHEQGKVEDREVLPTKKVSEKEAKQLGL